MPGKYHLLPRLVIVALLSGAVGKAASSGELAGIEQTLQAVRDSMDRSPAPWADEWKQEYLETIRIEIERHREASHFAERLEILRKGFEPYWESFKKGAERSLFEVDRAQVQWYVEHLMRTEFPSDDERQKLRDQYTEIWDHAANSLLAQFPFLDPNAVQKAKQDDLSVCYRKIEAPLMPIYLKPMSEEQVAQIKQRWDELRYARVDLWRSVKRGSTMPGEKRDVSSSSVNPDYELTKESLSQLLGLVWLIVPQRPDYYLSALEKRSKAIQQRVQSKGQARSEQQRLEKGRSRQLLQTEHISFLLAALLETPASLHGSASIRPQEETPGKHQDKTAKGGDAYEVDNGSPEK